ncbi:hypothetical protein [Pyrobaculum ferrireducens]|uniref:hypothetical protein n=1 Tax=Pyrobaculum ferrireducens TaxID=1104324 RepID=UPI000A5C4056|nr:hypothetical protein [Pyrobaculum ferrireducens]
MELPPTARYKMFKTKKYAIYYLLDDVEVRGEPEKKFVRGGHMFYFFGGAVVIKPVKESSQVQEAPSA